MNYIDDIDLERTRMHRTYDEQIEEPAFYEQLRALELGELPAFSLMEAVTFGNVMVACAPLKPAMLFHELIQVIQYRLLGMQQFATLYARRLLTSGSYDLIPLEFCAYQLAKRCAGHGSHFDVEAEVQLQIAKDGF